MTTDMGSTEKSGPAVPNQPQVQVPSRSASRELDALVAEKVMGYRWSACTGMAELVLDDPQGFPMALRYDTNGELRAADRLPHYSTDIAAAETVAERLRRERDAWIDIADAVSGWSVTLTLATEDGIHVAGEHHGTGESAKLSHAICLAALAAVGAA